MTAQEIEVWVRDVVTAVLQGQPVEDSKIELKSLWLPARKAADRLAGHANAARGVPILWIIGVDEQNQKLIGADPLELASWYKSVEKYFDGFAPRLVDVVVRIENSSVVGLYFETEQGAPYVVESSKGSSRVHRSLARRDWSEGCQTRRSFADSRSNPQAIRFDR